MSTTTNIHDILSAALREIRERHGVAIETLSVQWISAVENPARAVVHIEFQGKDVP